MGNAANTAAACILSPWVFVYCGAWGEVGGCKIKNVSAHAKFALYEPVYIYTCVVFALCESVFRRQNCYVLLNSRTGERTLTLLPIYTYIYQRKTSWLKNPKFSTQLLSSEGYFLQLNVGKNTVYTILKR